jgi:hypothetical protein
MKIDSKNGNDSTCLGLIAKTQWKVEMEGKIRLFV